MGLFGFLAKNMCVKSAFTVIVSGGRLIVVWCHYSGGNGGDAESENKRVVKKFK